MLVPAAFPSTFEKRNRFFGVRREAKRHAALEVLSAVEKGVAAVLSLRCASPRQAATAVQNLASCNDSDLNAAPKEVKNFAPFVFLRRSKRPPLFPFAQCCRLQASMRSMRCRRFAPCSSNSTSSADLVVDNGLRDRREIADDALSGSESQAPRMVNVSG